MTLSKTCRGLGCLSPFVIRSEDPGKAMAYLMLGGNKFWFRIVPRWLPQATNFVTGISLRTMQYLGSV